MVRGGMCWGKRLFTREGEGVGRWWAGAVKSGGGGGVVRGCVARETRMGRGSRASLWRM